MQTFALTKIDIIFTAELNSISLTLFLQIN